MDRYIRKVSKYGSVTIPVKIRRELGIKGGTVLSMEVKNNSIILKIFNGN